MKLVLQVALGIILAGVIIFALKILFFSALVKVATEEMHQVTSKTKANSERMLLEAKVARQKLESKMRADRIRKSSVVTSTGQGTVVRHVGESELNGIKLSSSTHYSRHWSEFYEESEECVYPSSTAVMVECVDAKKKAKENFDMLYKSGHFKGR